MRTNLILIFLVFSFVNQLFGENWNDIKIISSTQSELIFEFSPKYIDYKSFSKDKEGRILPLFEFASDRDYTYPGLPDYRYRLIPIGLPNQSGNSIQILSNDYIDLVGVSLKRIPALKNENGFLIESDDFLNQQKSSTTQAIELVKFGDVGISRDRIIGKLKIYPYEEISNLNIVRIYTKLVVRISYGLPASNLHYSSDESPLDNILLNSDISKSWTISYKNNLVKQPTNSVLSSGVWYRIKITEEGIYRLDNSLLKSKGIDLSSVDPRTIKIYSNGGRALDENPETSRPSDLVENAIFVSGENDGKFDEGDYILFYGVGTKGIEYSYQNRTFNHYYNNYIDNNYYWFTFGGANGKRMQNKESLNSTDAELVTTTTGFYFLEESKKNIAHTGRNWVGDFFNDRTTYRVYTNKLPGLIPGQIITYRIAAVSRSTKITSFTFEENSSQFGTMIFNPIFVGNEIYGFADYRIQLYTRNSDLPDGRSVLKMTYNPASDPIAEGYLDYFEILYPRYLKADNDKIQFFSPAKTKTIEYKISEFSNSEIAVFDVTDFSGVKIISNGKISGGEFTFQANESENNLSKYFAMGKNGYSVPSEIIRMNNQNLHGITDGAEFIIITPTEFKVQAERLKNYKTTRKNFPLKSIVVDINEIYNEFSGGLLDVTAIRDFIRYAYMNWTTKPLYVLLLGDGNYDYRNIEGYGKNFIPPYETLESFGYLINSYPTDDYYARIVGDDLNVDIALGRINCASVDESAIVVDKIINYETKSDLGSWRNLFTFVADDGLQSKNIDDKELHTGQSESLANNRTPKVFDQKKIYLIQYPTIETAQGRRKPAVNKAIIDAINEGTLVLNYIGHGNPEVWAHEYVFEKSVTIPQLKNKSRLFFLSAATCDFGEYDVPSSQSSAELLVLKSDGGAIAAFSSARAVYSHQNAAINETLFSNLFSWVPLRMRPIPIGYAYFVTKSIYTDVNDQKFHLLGDPTIYLNIPKFNSSIDSINKNPLNTVIEIKSLTQTELIGTVRDSLNRIMTNFNGEALITVYDSKRFQEITEWPVINGYFTITLSGGIVFRGRSIIKDGMFKANFVVPKDVSYENNLGKITVYFRNSEEDGVGYSESIKIVASDSVSTSDKNGPSIKILFDNEFSENGYLVSSSPLLIVKMEDETGINTTGTGIGHKIEAIIDDDISNSIDLSPNFQGELDKGNKSGVVNYKLSNLASGVHSIKVTAWDVFNNPASAIKEFEVVGDNILAIRDVYNYPNPAKDQTTFTFQHNYDKPVDVDLAIFTIAGRKILTIHKENIVSKFVMIEWDGRDNEGSYLGNGVYLYKIIVKTTDNSLRSEEIGKLAIVR